MVVYRVAVERLGFGTGSGLRFDRGTINNRRLGTWRSGTSIRLGAAVVRSLSDSVGFSTSGGGRVRYLLLDSGSFVVFPDKRLDLVVAIVQALDLLEKAAVLLG
jgi:hypothetical protein